MISKAEKDRRLENGICIQCGKRPAKEGRVRCEECLQRNREYGAKRNARPDVKERKLAWQKNERAKCEADGICVMCMKRPARPGLKTCQVCADSGADRYYEARASMTPEELRAATDAKNAYNRLWVEQHSEERKAAGLCPRCGKKATDGKILCETCRAKARVKARMATRRRREEKGDFPRSERAEYGLCYWCGKPAIPDKSLCESCMERARGNAKRMSDAWRERGMADHVWKAANRELFGGHNEPV